MVPGRSAAARDAGLGELPSWSVVAAPRRGHARVGGLRRARARVHPLPRRGPCRRRPRPAADSGGFRSIFHAVAGTIGLGPASGPPPCGGAARGRRLGAARQTAMWLRGTASSQGAALIVGSRLSRRSHEPRVRGCDGGADGPHAIVLLSTVLALSSPTAPTSPAPQTSDLAFLYQASRTLPSASGAATASPGCWRWRSRFRARAQVCRFACRRKGRASRISVGGPRRARGHGRSTRAWRAS